MSRLISTGGFRALFHSFCIGIQLLALGAVTSQMVVGQTALVSGSNHPGTLSANGSESFTFTGNASENIVLRVGAQSFAPKIELSGPNGIVVATAPTVAPGGGNRDAVLTSKLASAGAYTVKVSSYYAGGAGTFTLRFAQIPGTFTVSAGDEGGPLVSGGRSNGAIDIGDLDVWTFSANSGDSIQLRIGSSGTLVPQITLYGPDGAQVGTAPAVAPGSGGRDAVISTRLTQNGNYTVIANSYYLGGVGSYILSLAQAPGTITVATNDEGGDLPNGAHTDGVIDTGDLDVWSFAGNAGDSVQIRMGTGSFPPKLDLYAPDGTVVETAPAVAQGSGGRDVVIETRLAASGKFTLVTSAYYSGSSGSYTVNLIQAPGDFIVPVNDQGGALTNGWRHTGTLDVGDLDAWSFQANAGDSIELRMGTTAYPPRVDLYAPSGALVDSAPKVAQGSGGRDVLLTARVAESGKFTVVASAYYSGSSGSYILSLAQAPGAVTIAPNDEGGALVNGARHSARLEIGDLDVWTFSGNAGDNVQLRMGGEFPPRVDLYGPNGALIESAPAVAQGSGGRDVLLDVQLPSTGAYTVVSGAYYSGSSGAYALNFIRVPGEPIVISPNDQGGSLTNGWSYTGSIDFGDIDVYTFEGTAGEDIYLRLGSSDLVPRLDLFGPNGAVVASVPAVAPGSGGRDVFITNRLTSDGLYTAVASAYYSGDTGGYTLTLGRSREEAINASGDEGGRMTNGYTYFGSNAMGDLDVWTFYGTVGDSNVFRIGTTNYVPWLRLYGPGGTLVKDAFTASIQNRTNQLSYVITTNGIYTLVSSSYYLNQSGTYNLKQARVPPDINNLPDSIAIDEGTALNVTISAQDPDVPDKVLTFSLENAPPGVTLTAQGATNAVLSWATTEGDGPSTNDFLVKVTDVANNVSFTRTNSFRVVVNEVNLAPALTVPADLRVDEMTPLSNVSATATDADLPKNGLKYSLVDPPAGMQVNETTGAISWVPAEDQGPGTYAIKVVVTDDSPSAVNSKQLSTTNSFQIVVNEVNRPPDFAIAEQVINEGDTLQIPVAVTDPDLPSNGLSFELSGAPQGMTFDPVTRIISWKPTEEQGPSTNRVTLTVTDDSPGAANPHLSTPKTFSVTLNEVNSPPSLPQIGEQRIDELTTLTITNSAADLDVPIQGLSYRLVTPPDGVTVSTNGVITWTPTELQGPNTNTITTVVTDNGTPPMSATNSIVVIVNEVNVAPVLAEISAQSAHFGTLLSVQASATDADLPANQLTYTLEGAPTGMTIAGGSVSWTPLESQVGVYSVTVRVTDNGTPSKSDAKTFQVTVSGAGSRIEISMFSPSSIKLILTGDAGNQYQLQKSANLKDWETIVQLPLKETPTQQIEEFSGAATFYRLKLVQ